MDETPSLPLDTFCPECPLPPTASALASAATCSYHLALLTGSDDMLVNDQWYSRGTSDTDTETNRATCDFIHRGKVLAEPLVKTVPHLYVGDS